MNILGQENSLDRKIRKGEICPYCHEKPILISSSVIYGRHYGMIYLCRDCDAYVGVHNGTKHALGRLANAELRKWKKLAHAYFDALWKRKIRVDKCSKTQARKAAYSWLAKEMGIPHSHAHIGMFTIEQCKQVVELCKPYNPKSDK